MRVEPDLPEHPKYLRLKRLVGEYAMEALIRLWAHCQKDQRGGAWAGVDSEYVELVCNWEGEPGLLFRSLQETKWLHTEPEGVIVHQWDDRNSRFRANWSNGKNSTGRPRKPNSHFGFTPGTNGADKSASSGISGAKTETQSADSVNPIPDSVKPMETQSEIRNYTKLNCTDPEGGAGETEPNNPNADWVNPTERMGLRYDLAREVLKFLNEKTGAAFQENQATLWTIAARLQEVAQDLPGICQMISRQAALWSEDPEMKNFLRPKTLFSEDNFPDYYGQRKMEVPGVGKRKATASRERAAELLSLIEKSPANKESVYHNPHATAEEKQKLREWREELRKS